MLVFFSDDAIQCKHKLFSLVTIAGQTSRLKAIKNIDPKPILVWGVHTTLCSGRYLGNKSLCGEILYLESSLLLGCVIGCTAMNSPFIQICISAAKATI